MSHSALKRALEHFDNNQSKFAAAIGTSQQLVSYWLKTEKSLPAEYVLKTEEMTGISRHELRPDIYPREDPTNPKAPSATNGRSENTTDPAIALPTDEAPDRKAAA